MVGSQLWLLGFEGSTTVGCFISEFMTQGWRVEFL